MSKLEQRIKRKYRIRRKLSGTTERPRLTVYKSLKHIYAQVVDDTSGKTLAFASTLSKELKGELKGKDEGGKDEGGKDEGGKKAGAKRVGALIAQKCKAVQVEAVVFDRNGFPYHGRIAAVADAARAAGLKF